MKLDDYFANGFRNFLILVVLIIIIYFIINFVIIIYFNLCRNSSIITINSLFFFRSKEK